ncbi:MAG: hypothetical protein JWM10_3901, partial [Myxococcaceae bacterium]|nr:hypothetical protein [Myxococcaceae bacterium]
MSAARWLAAVALLLGGCASTETAPDAPADDDVAAVEVDAPALDDLGPADAGPPPRDVTDAAARA